MRHANCSLGQRLPSWAATFTSRRCLLCFFVFLPNDGIQHGVEAKHILCIARGRIEPIKGVKDVSLSYTISVSFGDQRCFAAPAAHLLLC